MSFIRPEARAAIWRWREVIAGAAMIALGGYWAFAGFGAAALVGWAIFLVGILGLVAGLQRAMVRPRSGGPGVIELDEGQLTYLHPDNGAIVALPEVVRIEIVTTSGGPFADDMFWVFTGASGHVAQIPASALGAEKLFDALAGFPGADYRQVIEASGSTGDQLFVIWQKLTPRLH